MEGIRQNGVVLREHPLKKGWNVAASRFISFGEEQWQYRIEGQSISFWRGTEMSPSASWRFSEGCEIVDACSMPFADGSRGVVIAVNDFEGSDPVYFLAYYSFARRSVVKKIRIKNQISCIFVVIGNGQESQISELNSGLRNAPHWIAVGTKGGSCYLTHFNINSPSDIDLRISSPVFSTNVSSTTSKLN
ncbi:unnamed protein product [Enterobius vermicularis]|uniref:DUF295 domain-containing protein n=1 Tax=Enterobius vermicularis TaxID=51028 RepID=A0A0N4VKM2_ENTVE|nr:unnamed protein product [Enterobius vermicularis]